MRPVDRLVQPTKVYDPFLADLGRLVRRERERMADPIAELKVKVTEMIVTGHGDLSLAAQILVEVLRTAHEAGNTPEEMACAIGRIEGLAEVAFARLGLLDPMALDEQKKNATPVTT